MDVYASTFLTFFQEEYLHRWTRAPRITISGHLSMCAGVLVVCVGVSVYVCTVVCGFVCAEKESAHANAPATADYHNIILIDYD